jgi:hypothetical protein
MRSAICSSEYGSSLATPRSAAARKMARPLLDRKYLK